MTFRRQLIIGQIASVLVIAATALTAILALRATTHNVDRVTQRFADSVKLVQRLRLGAEQLVATSRGLLLTGHDQYQRRFDALASELEAALHRLEITAATEANVEVVAVQCDATDYIAAVTRAARERARTGDLRQIVELFDDDLAPRRAAFERSVAAFARDEQTRLDRSLQRTEQLTHRAQLTLAFTAAIAIMIGRCSRASCSAGSRASSSACRPPTSPRRARPRRARSCWRSCRTICAPR